MVFKKNYSRIISIILAFCALTALCAVCAAAVNPSIIQYRVCDFRNHYVTGSTLPLSKSLTINSSSSVNYVMFGFDCSSTARGTYYFEFQFTLPSQITLTKGTNLYFAGSTQNPGSETSKVSNFAYSSTPDSSGYLYFVSGTYTTTSSFVVFHVSINLNTSTAFTYKFVSCYFSDTPMPEPEPEPDPAPDGWIYPSSDLYFTNISNSSFVFNNTNYPFSSFPSKDIIIDDSPTKIIVGSFFENTRWLSSGSTVSGQLQIQFTSPLTSVDNFVQRGFIWLVNGSDPSLSGFQYYEVPTSWDYMFTVWKYGINQWTNEYIFNFEFTFPSDLSQTIGFTPVNILFGLYGFLPTGSFDTECWYNVQNLVFGYYTPPSSGQPQVPSTPVFNNPDNTSTVINPSEPTITDNLNSELGFYDNVWKSYNLTSDTFIDFFEEVIGFGATNLDDALGRLYQSFSYSGAGSIYLPAATIPFGDSELHLWDQTEIPLSHWFFNLPSQIKVVFGFIIVFSVASACWGIAFFFIRKIVSGNYQSSDF